MTTKTKTKTKQMELDTPEHNRHFDAVADRYIYELTHPLPFEMAPVLRWLDVAYRLYDLKRPERVEIVDSPFAALKLATELTGETQDRPDCCGVADGGWVALYECFHDFQVITPEESADVLALRDFGRVACDSVLLDECAIVIRRPSVLLVDDDGNMHSSTGPCIQWADGECDYAHHGTWIPKRMVEAPTSYTKEEYLAITNTEERRALSEIAGWNWVLELLGGSSLDRWVDPATGLSYELLGCDGGQRLLRKQSPPLANGTQPFYVEPVHEDLRTAQAARKWQATTLAPVECERDPELSYGIET
jgi:hypothetical protein